ncbi:MAG: ABC transporter ATP-binding protein/permease [Oscillospiraceae bacterium]|nr:ABC transporter ATP-binding protein/permease [Oscillospiraceae bacterium]
MLNLINIKKDYSAGSSKVQALKGINLSFRESEFVAILGHSGCGKTTMLNIIGGLDHYSEGDLIINGRSTKDFSAADWDSYRNHSIGFVFQSYNLIPHQSVLRNVELALTLSGVNKTERRKRAQDALTRVGLADQMKKRPNQLSGGQMQRVAIARALVNDPDILLADEPTGALDSETSVQVMDILKEIAREKLVIMVTHNPELADAYATRIVRLKDGEIVDDTAPFEADPEKPAQMNKRLKKPSMSLFTAFSLSLNNLMTKKGRTILTAFAGSIGIIGIALILSLSNGINTYINQVQEDTLSSYPITIESEIVDMGAMMLNMMGENYEESTGHDTDKVYSSHIMVDMMDSMLNAETRRNNLRAFKSFLDEGGNGISDLATIRYTYDFAFDFYTKDPDGVIIKSDVMEFMQDAMSTMYGGDFSSFFSSSMGSMYAGFNVWEELLTGENGELISDTVKEQYDLLWGSWPTLYDEVVIFLDSHNEMSDLMLYALGLVSKSQIDEGLVAIRDGEEYEAEQMSWTYEEIADIDFKLILPAEYYRYDALTDSYVDMSLTDAGMDYLYNGSDVGTPLKVVGIVRPNAESTSTMVSGAIGYTNALTEYAIDATMNMDIVLSQQENPEIDVFSALPFATGEEIEPSDEEKKAAITEHLSALSTAEKAEAYLSVSMEPAEEYVSTMVEQQMAQLTRESIEEMIVTQYATEMGVDEATIMGYIGEMSDEALCEQVEVAMDAQIRQGYADAVSAQMAALSQDNLASALDMILEGDEMKLAYMGMAPFEAWQFNYLYDNFMPPTLSEGNYEDNMDLLGYVDPESPTSINIYATTFADKDLIADIIAEYNASVPEEDYIEYTDYVALLMSSITSIISGISYLLIAFVSIALVVSSIMIGVITLISVQERTKEIGILRAVGASKRDVSRVFNAETMIVGLSAGIVGIVVTLILIVPINAILLHYTGLEGLKAALPPEGGAALIIISALLTLIAGLIPSRVAAKKDPVEALRTE